MWQRFEPLENCGLRSPNSSTCSEAHGRSLGPATGLPPPFLVMPQSRIRCSCTDTTCIKCGFDSHQLQINVTIPSSTFHVDGSPGVKSNILPRKTTRVVLSK